MLRSTASIAVGERSTTHDPLNPMRLGGHRNNDIMPVILDF